ncbi:unnamed protein product [Notodromas monacha]|uniref:Thioredoxin-like protein 1 n=1 Tax=Notodromas monacha TaxID=399045 RepID=A0A7R9GCC1_9CRUS|nr:unnamed protein product [Notodromas monacha]CAG0915822.1 unnamed protein product [Notodromas monacha]
MANLKTITEESQYKAELEAAGSRLVVVDFMAEWCQPCLRMGPVLKEFALRYPNAVFLKVDVDQQADIASRENVSSLPTFILFKLKCKIDQMKGADAVGLEAKIKEHYVSGDGDGSGGDSAVPGQLDLTAFIVKSNCECLNEDNQFTWENALKNDDSVLKSDCDEQIILGLSFRTNVKLHSLVIRGPRSCGPKTVKLFSNLTNGLDFDSAQSKEPTQTIIMTEDDIEQGKPQTLKYVKFQNVHNVTMFIQDNQEGTELTEVTRVQFFGSPISITNMEEFKRVSGTKGEAHF